MHYAMLCPLHFPPTFQKSIGTTVKAQIFNKWYSFCIENNDERMQWLLKMRLASQGVGSRNNWNEQIIITDGDFL
jgi:hypothetical protein